jgi:uncharacterized protein YjbI with pentapeptide repeats
VGGTVKLQRLWQRRRRLWRRHRWPRLLIGFVVAAGVLVGAAWLLFWFLPPSLARDDAADPAKAEGDARTAVIQGVGGLLLLGGLFFTYRTLQLNRQGQITDRFTKAIGQLGDDKLDVRLGGIYALERIARDSDDDHRTIMEVLTAFVREHSARAAPGPTTGIAILAAAPVAPSPDDAQGEPEKLSTDVEAVLTVLKRRRPRDRGDDRLDLSGAHLEGAFFVGASLEKTSFADAHLDRASFSGAGLKEAGFWRARLGWTTFSNADLKEAYFVGADLTEALLQGADLQGAHFHEAKLTNASFYGADLRRAHLGNADLEGAIFEYAHLEGANLSATNVSAALSWTGATADHSTRWPSGFNPFDQGVHGPS